MKREEKNALSRQRIIEAAMQEFSAKGYAGASLTTVCAERGISKGIIYHHFKDKDEIYLLCVKECFNALTEYMKKVRDSLDEEPEQRLLDYFDARLRFFAENPVYLGIFADAVFNPPKALAAEIAVCRKKFGELNAAVLTEFLNGSELREGLEVSAIVEDFRAYMDFFNLRFKDELENEAPTELLLKKHEERCHRRLEILLHGVLG